MSSQLPSDAHGVNVPNDHRTVDAPRREVVALAVESQTCRVAGSDGICDIFGIVLEQIIVGQEQIHFHGVAKVAEDQDQLAK